ncbi:MAG TPA: cation:proton antiporter, partial [Bacteroidales bacterium]|nr:cation:proton antiporter [Bacteroidales bacterium]
PRSSCRQGKPRKRETFPLFISFLAALSSSALVLKLLQERSEITSNYGRTVLGILIFQDLLLAPLLLFTNLLASESVNISHELILLSLKVALIIGLVYTGNRWVIPRLLYAVARTRNQELFIMSVFLICFSVALLTSTMGMSLAFGAFLAGMMISESEYSHNVFGNFLPIKDIFTSFFFVSVGMLLDIRFVTDNFQLVATTVILVIVIKTFIAGGTGFILGHTLKGTILVGLSLSQVGEFSFILAELGSDYQIITDYWYKLFLAVAVITMALTPVMFYLVSPLYKIIVKLHPPRLLINGLFPLPETEIPEFTNHLVIIGKDATAIKLSTMARMQGIQHISIVFDPSTARDKMKAGDLVVYGDAVNEPVLRKAHADTADIVVISVGSIIPAMNIIQKVRTINVNALIIVRTPLIQNVEDLYKIGANHVIPEKLEIAIDLFNIILETRVSPGDEVARIIGQIRNLSPSVFSKE